MYSFRNDYLETAHPDVLNAIIDTNMEQTVGYGLDGHCENAARIIKGLVGCQNADVHFLVGGTQTNLLAISAFLRPHEAVIAADTAHIATHETGAVEATGHKIVTVSTKDGKITTSQVKEQLEYHMDEHMVKPRMVEISNSTELGTVYNKKELTELSMFCKENGLLFYIDGARIGTALAHLKGELTFKDMYDLTDAFYIGGTKNGALMGEALIIRNDSLKRDFRYLIKQRGAMLAKGKILGVQFETLLKDGLYLKLSEHANNMARILDEGIKSAGYSFLTETVTNQLFPILPNDVADAISEKFGFQFWQKHDENSNVIRFITSWATKEEAAREFCAEISKMPRG